MREPTPDIPQISRPATPLEPEPEICPSTVILDHVNGSADQNRPPPPPANRMEEDHRNPTPDPAVNALGDPPSDEYDEPDPEDPPILTESDEEPLPSDDEDDPNITLETMKMNLRFVQMVEDAKLESQFSAAELDAFRNPQENQSSPSDDPDLQLSIDFYISSLDHTSSEKAYAASRCRVRRLIVGLLIKRHLTFGSLVC